MGNKNVKLCVSVWMSLNLRVSDGIKSNVSSSYYSTILYRNNMVGFPNEHSYYRYGFV